MSATKMSQISRYFFSTRSRDCHHRMSALFRPQNIVPKGMKVNKEETAISQRLLVDNGFIRQSSSGIFHYLPLGSKVLNKLINLIDESMSKIDGQKIEMPSLLSAHLWKKTGRWEEVGSELLKLTDRHGKEYCLGPTHEESVTQILASLSNLSYRNFPLRLYQISKKFRDEMKPRLGLLRAKEFVMKDMYSFDTSPGDSETAYEVVCEAYTDLFANKLHLDHLKVLAATGSIGGSLSHEFHVKCQVGEDNILTCQSCSYGINEQHRVEEKQEPRCPNCGGELSTHSAIEVGHTFLLGTKYSKVMGASFLNSSGKQQYLEMGCFGIGVSRIIAAAVEVLSKNGEIRWPLRIAPYVACIIPPKAGSLEESATLVAEELRLTLTARDLFLNDIVIDDRTEMTIGKRLMEARKIGIPFIVVVGKPALQEEPKFELQNLRTEETVFLTLDGLVSHFRNLKENFF